MFFILWTRFYLGGQKSFQAPAKQHAKSGFFASLRMTYHLYRALCFNIVELQFIIKCLPVDIHQLGSPGFVVINFFEHINNRLTLR